MKLSRRLGLIVVLVASFFLFAGIAGAAVSFPDVPTGHPYYEAISGMADRGIIGGFTSGNFGPSDLVTRQQFAKMIVLTMGLTVEEDDFPAAGVPFTDLGADDSSSLHPHEYVAVCALNNITTGKTATTFEPLSNITRQQVITMIVRAADNLSAGALDAVPTPSWTGVLAHTDPTHGANTQKAEYNGLLDGLNSANGGLATWTVSAKATRGEVAQMLWNLLGLLGPSGTWADFAPASPPTPRHGHVMVNLYGKNKILMFGGVAELGGSTIWENVTYEYDLALNKWSALTIGGSKPTARWGHAMAYCVSNGQVILFGGHSLDGDLNDMWRFDPTSGTWTELHPSGTLPPGRAHHMMVYVPTTGKVILFGGAYLPSGTPGYRGLADMWSYDPAANTWTELHPSGGPGVCTQACLAYDPASNKLVLFGGRNPSGQLYNDTWLYDPAANTWTNATPSGTVPVRRYATAYAFDPDKGNLVVFGGLVTDQLNVSNEAWTYSPATNTWTQLATAVSPPARYSTAMVYEPVAKRMILFGGIPRLNEGKLGDTWVFTE